MYSDDTTRGEFLAAGAAILAESAARVSLRALTVRAVTVRARRSTGAFYHHWRDQDAYRRDLVDHMTSPETGSAEAPLLALLARHDIDAATFCGAVWDHVVALAAEPAFRRRMLLLTLGDPDATAAVARLYVRADAAVTSAVTHLLHTTGREPIDGLDLADIAAVLAAVVDGVAIRRLVDDGGATDRRVCDVASAVLDHATRPAGTTHSLAGLVDAVASRFASAPVPAGHRRDDSERSRHHPARSVAVVSGSDAEVDRTDVTRVELLEAGAAIFGELATNLSLRPLTVSAVARRVGRSTSALYHYWPTQEDYVRDLIGHITDPAAAIDRSAFADALGDLDDTAPSWRQIVEFVDQRCRSVGGSPEFWVQTFLLVAPDEGTSSAVRGLYARYQERAEASIGAILHASGLTLRADRGADDLAIALAALIDGAAVRRTVFPGSIDATTVEALLASLVARMVDADATSVPARTDEVRRPQAVSSRRAGGDDGTRAR